MMKFLNDALMGFRPCFSRSKAFSWFVVIVVGFMARGDGYGVTSVMRSLLIEPTSYAAMLAFFRSSAWTLEALSDAWSAIVRKIAPIWEVDGAAVLVGDGVLKSKEGRKMPGAKKHHQDSETSSKPSYIWGHLFGAVGVLASNNTKVFCVPLALTLQAGVKAIFGWGDASQRQGTHPVELINLAHKASAAFGKALLLLDSYFLSAPVLKRLDELDAGSGKLHIITKAKESYKAFRAPIAKEPGRRGAPAKRGEAVKLKDVFAKASGLFVSAEIELYGKLESVRYHFEDLLWSPGLYKKLRFVFVEYGGARAILASTNLSLDPATIIHLYGRRFKVEFMFREMKQVVFSFSYRFWSKLMPKLSKRQKKTDPEPMSLVSDPTAQAAIKRTVKAIEGYVFCCAVATGLLQIVSLVFSPMGLFSNVRYLRVRRNDTASEATVAEFFQKRIFQLLAMHADLGICKIINGRISKHICDDSYDKAV